MNRRIGLLLGGLLLALGFSASAEEVPADVQLHQHGHGWHLSDDKGMSVYISEKDTDPGKSNCEGQCAKAWPPLAATDDKVNDAEWGIITRPDGIKQRTFKGQPLYRSSQDVAPGDAFGDGQNDQWRLAFKPIPMPPGITFQRTLLGYVLSDAKGLTFYTFDKDTPTRSACDLKCTDKWVPIKAPAMASPIVDWTIVTRDDGTKQWAFKGKPIYRYADEVQVAETLGENVEGRWHAAVLEPPPAKPGWVKFHHTDGGEVLTNAQGYTIYTFDEGRRGLGGNAKVVIDNPDKWVPVLASADDKPIGMWTIVEAKPGERQWAQNGLPLYTCKEDLAPGDVRGVRFGDRRFKPIMRNGLPMPGT